MKPPDKIFEKGKKATAQANILRSKAKKQLNRSGNRSFLNKSVYVNELRSNNRRLAHSLAAEKRKVAILYEKLTECRAALFQLQSTVGPTRTNVKIGISRFKAALDLIIEASDKFTVASDFLDSVCNEGPTSSTSTQAGGVTHNSSNYEVHSPSNMPQMNCHRSFTHSSASGNFFSQPPVLNSSDKICATRPMVQGQVISKPTISLQRLAVPTRTLGQGTATPVRGIHLDEFNAEEEGRLSVVPEEACEMSERDLSGGGSAPSPQISLPPSHVLLERICTNIQAPLSDLDPSCVSDEDSQKTVCLFGKLRYDPETSFSSDLTSGILCQQRKPLSPESPGCIDLGMPSKSSSNQLISSSNSDEFETESSSEDEGLALQIVESKRQYLERNRQVEAKEGTSWNYDESGTFHERPPKKRKVMGPKRKVLRRKSKGGVNVKEAQSYVVDEPQSQTLPALCVSSPTSMNHEQTLYEGDMSFTCVPAASSTETSSPRKSQDGGNTKDPSSDPACEREAFITKRSHSRKLYFRNLDVGKVPSPMSSPFNKSPKSPSWNGGSNRKIVKAAVPTSHSFVVLQRLPSDITTGHKYNVSNETIVRRISKSGKVNSPELLQSNVNVSHLNLSDPRIGKKKFSFPNSSDSDTEVCPKRAPVRQLPSYSSDEDSREGSSTVKPDCRSEEMVVKSPIKRPGKSLPKQQNSSKLRKKDPKVPKSLNHQSSGVSIETTPQQENPVDANEPHATPQLSESASEEHSNRPRRNAAPVTLKEPKLTGKLRRP